MRKVPVTLKTILGEAPKMPGVEKIVVKVSGVGEHVSDTEAVLAIRKGHWLLEKGFAAVGWTAVVTPG